MNEELKLYPYLHISMLEDIAEQAGYNRYELRYKILGGANINNICKKLSLREEYVYNGKPIPFLFDQKTLDQRNNEARRYNAFLKYLKDKLNLHEYDAIIVDMSWDAVF